MTILILIPLFAFLLTSLVYIVAHSLAMETITIEMAAAGCGAFGLYFYIVLGILMLIRLPWSWRLGSAAAAPILALGVVAIWDLFDPPARGFIRIDRKTLWVLPGIFLYGPLKDVVFPMSLGGAHIQTSSRQIVSVREALLQPDGSCVLLGDIERRGYANQWALVGRVFADGRVDQDFHPQRRELPSLSFHHSRSAAVGLVLTEVDARTGIGRLNSSGRIDRVATLPWQLNGVRIDGPITGLVEDARGRFLIAGSIVRDDGPTRLDFSPLVRLLPSGDLDPSFQVSWTAAYLHGGGRPLLEANGGILFLTSDLADREVGLRSFSPDGEPNPKRDAAFSGLVAKLGLGRVQEAVFGSDGRLLLLFQPESYGPAYIVDANAPAPVKVEIGRPVRSFSAFGDGGFWMVGGQDPASPWASIVPTLLRADADLRAHEIPGLGEGIQEIRVLGPRPDGGVWVSLVHRETGSRLVALDRTGRKLFEVPF